MIIMGNQLKERYLRMSSITLLIKSKTTSLLKLTKPLKYKMKKTQMKKIS